jgi:hypothetical protein
LAAFVDDHGVLAHLLEEYLARQNSILAQTLARQVGESSPLLLEAQLRRVTMVRQSSFAHSILSPTAWVLAKMALSLSTPAMRMIIGR